jgi:hypothetical protein
MVKDDKLIGVIGVYRQSVQPFSQKEVDLAKSKRPPGSAGVAVAV